MAAANGSKALRVLVVYGSESGNAEHAAQKLVATWAAKKGTNVTVDPEAICGGDAAKRFDSLKDDYDVLIVLTSSFGEGEAPSNYEKFLLMLAKGAKAESPPLKGLQHAVLGFGDSSYETFMNCPRLTDKFLEECGSRRIHKRFEIDASEQDTRALEEQWKEGVWQALQSRPEPQGAQAAPWCEEGKTDKIYPKSLSELGEGYGHGNPVVQLLLLLVALAGAAAAYYHFSDA